MRNEKGQFMKGSKPVNGFKKGYSPPNPIKRGEHRGVETEFKKGHIPHSKIHPEIMPRGENNHRWVSDRNKLQRYNDENKDRRSSAYNAWRKQVWLRDGFKCKISNTDCKGRLEAHHILGYKEYSELRYEVNNGITLCHFHHPKKKEDEKRLSPYFMELVSVLNEKSC